jgi:2-dehydropantoate 2-reductase
MHVTVVGAGVLGRVYGVRLAADGEQVSFVVRPDHAPSTSPFVIEQVNGGERRDVIASPKRVTEIPEGASVVLVAVRSNEIEPSRAPASFDVPSILRRGGSRSAPVVVLTPMLPGQRQALEQAAERRIVPAMPGVVGYLNERGAVRYWIPSATTTLIDGLPSSIARGAGGARGAGSARGPSDAGGEEARAVLETFARRLTQLGVPTRLEPDVGSLNTATTVAFYPLIAAIDAGSGIDGVLGNKELFRTVLDAAKESDGLARKIGKSAAWTSLLLKFVGPFTLKPGVALARRLFPESVLFVERHFGPKLHEQHLAMGKNILALGREHGVSMPALERLMEVLGRRPAAD